MLRDRCNLMNLTDITRLIRIKKGLIVDYIKYKNFQHIKFKTINFGKNNFGHIFRVSDKHIFGQMFTSLLDV